MARPTTWRRSFNVGGFLAPEGSMDLLTVQPNETLGATWWQYSLRSIGNVTTNDEPPLSNAVVVVGLILVDFESGDVLPLANPGALRPPRDRKSTRLNSSHMSISYAVFCLKKKKKTKHKKHNR